MLIMNFYKKIKKKFYHARLRDTKKESLSDWLIKTVAINMTKYLRDKLKI